MVRRAFTRKDIGTSILAICRPARNADTKAAFVPFHVWASEAYPAAPAHVSALMSGAMSKLAFYGIVRIVSFLGPPLPLGGKLYVLAEKAKDSNLLCLDAAKGDLLWKQRLATVQNPLRSSARFPGHTGCSWTIVEFFT